MTTQNNIQFFFNHQNTNYRPLLISVRGSDVDDTYEYEYNDNGNDENISYNAIVAEAIVDSDTIAEAVTTTRMIVRRRIGM